jgi:proline iminopeptidase
MDVRYHRGELFPDTRPYETGLLDVGDGHFVYWEQSGNPRGVPVLFLHGGPGAGASPIHRRFFDPRFYRIIIVDQRGCGRSRPYAATAANTTAHLVRDLETLRIRLRVRRWLLFGGSWGSTLALAYGQRYPEACAGFVLRGVFLGTRREIDWFLTGMGRFFPEAHRAFRDFLDEDERSDILAGYHRRLMSPDPGVHGPAAIAWSRYESACSNLIPRTDEPARSEDTAALALARLEAHYFVHDVFLEDPLLDGMARLRHVPAIIVQGRYDMVCPVATAEALARAWPAAEFVVVPDAGHSALEPGIRAALVRATEAMKRRDRLGSGPHV